MPSDKLKREKDELIQTAYAECRTLISEYKRCAFGARSFYLFIYYYFRSF
jgi:hypothetical protein